MHTLSTMRRDMIKIETYWNVNKIITAIVSVFTAIKIETYWNVNDKRKIEAYNNEIRLK